MSKQAQHGYFNEVSAITILNESPEELRAFQDLYLTRFEPQDPVQLFLVEMMYESHLNFRRVARWKVGAMESLARECRNRAKDEGAMTDDGAFDYRKSNSLGNDMLGGNAMIGSVYNGDILEKAIRLEQRAMLNYIKAWDHLYKVRRDRDAQDFVWPNRKQPEPAPGPDLLSPAA